MLRFQSYLIKPTDIAAPVLWITAVILIFGVHGCSVVGPSAISRGRADYNEAVTRTDDQQILMALVHHRYLESIGLMAVSSVTANFSVQADTGINIGFGPSDNYAGNLVPLGGGFVYEENPTISYRPVKGAKYIRAMMSPLPLEFLIMFTRSVTWPEIPYAMLVKSVNDIRNPDFIRSPTIDSGQKFERFIELMISLRDAGIAFWGSDPGQEKGFVLVIRAAASAHRKDVRELLDLLGLPVPAEAPDQIVIPVYSALEPGRSGGIAISMRSVFDLMEILSASIDIPAAHARSGLVTAYPAVSLAGRDVRIRTSPTKPGSTAVAVQYRGVWFYIAETDRTTKEAFLLANWLWSSFIADAAGQHQAAPVLTVPASR